MQVACACQRRLDGTWAPGAPRRTEKRKWQTQEGERTEAVHRGGTTRSREAVPATGMERRGGGVEPDSMSQAAMGGADA